MKKFYYIPLLVILIFSVRINAQQRTMWEAASPSAVMAAQLTGAHRVFRLDETRLREVLKPAAKGGVLSRRDHREISLPDPEGSLKDYVIFETPVLAPELAARYPDIKSYTAVQKDAPEIKAYISLDDSGFHAMVKGGREAYYINASESRSGEHIIAYRSAFKESDHLCLQRDEEMARDIQAVGESVMAREVNDGLLRTYRMALACTGEYAQFHVSRAGVTNGTDQEKRQAVLSAMNTTMTRVNGIFRNDVGIQMQLIANNDQLIFLDPDTDNFTNNSTSTLLQEVQAIIDGRVGFTNYDIGHVFSTSNGGVAQLSSPCTQLKARGVSGLSNPVGDPYDVDFVSHEIGHQFGATHTFNNSCSDNRSANTSVEPGSGSTIMAYAGICQPNVQGDADAYFHAISIAQMWTNITEGNSTCAATTTVTNAAPEITDPTITTYNIPASTPFFLRAEATDANGDALTYSWEQLNNEVTAQPPVATATGGPNFRSRLPSVAPVRYFPNTSTLLQNQLQNTWEVLPSVNRKLNFALTVRDNNPNLGQTARKDVVVNIIDNGAAFAVTSQEANQSLSGGQTLDVTWEVSGTNEVPFNVAAVDIFLVINNDFEALVPLTLDTPNDGSQSVVIPGDLTTNNARILIKAKDNIFLALNKGTLSITPGNFALSLNTLEYPVCIGDDLQIPFDFTKSNAFTGTVTLSTANVPAGITTNFSQNNLTANQENIILTVGNTGALAAGNYTLDLLATSGSESLTYTLSLNLRDDVFEAVALSVPQDAATGVATDPVLEWMAASNATLYDIEVASDAGFSTIIFSAQTAITQLQLPQLDGETTYFWRVRPLNECATGTFGTPRSFTTIPVNCRIFSNNVPVSISTTDPQTVTSSINIADQATLNSLTVDVNISHTYVEDLVVSLTSPAGTTVVLLNRQCANGRNINATFSDEGAVLVCGSNPAISGVIAPQQGLEAFRNEPVSGTWILTVADVLAQDGGSVNSFSLDLCVNGDFAPDTDGDGVFDNADLCPDTPANTKVDVDGCPLFSLPSSNFIIQTRGESCAVSNDGSIIIETGTELGYTATLTGNSILRTESFSTQTLFEDVPSGTYELCFTVAENADYEQCFTVVIQEPQPLSVFKEVHMENKTVDLTLSGSDSYQIEWNGALLSSGSGRITLALKDGLNLLKVKGSLDCQGMVEEAIFAGKGAAVYPNPFRETLHIATPLIQTQVDLTFYSASGQLLYQTQVTTNDTGTVTVTPNLPTNAFYLLRVTTPEGSFTYKLVRS